MTLLLSEREVDSLADMTMAMEAVEDVFRMQARGQAINLPRRRVGGRHTSLHLMGGAIPAIDRIGLKAYIGGAGSTHFLVNLYRESTGELDAIIEAGRLGQLRTGAASGVSAKHLARTDAGVVAVIGSGYQARTQLEAVSLARDLTSARVYARDPDRRERFAAEMSAALNLDVVPVTGGEEACAGADLVITATNSPDPVLAGSWIAPGTHVMAMGANRIQARELDDASLASFDVIAADDIEQAKIESGDLTAAVEIDAIGWDGIVQMGDIVAGVAPGRDSPRQRTLFKSLGIAIWDIALADHIFRAAIAAGVGVEVNMHRDVSR